MLLMVEKGVRGGICSAFQRYTKGNNKYMDDYDENKESSYINYWGVNNSCGWAMSQRLPRLCFQCDEEILQFHEVFTKNYDEIIEVGYILEVDVKYPEQTHELHRDLPFFQERKKLGKVEKLVTNLHDKNEYVVHIISLKQALSNGLILKKFHSVIIFNQDEWLKPYIEKNNKLRNRGKK